MRTDMELSVNSNFIKIPMQKPQKTRMKKSKINTLYI